MVRAPHEEQGPNRSIRLRDGAAFCFAVFLCVRVLLSVVGIATVRAVDPPAAAEQSVSRPATPGWHNAFDATDRYDAGWFERIARDGYRWQPASAAFFPGYPLGIRLLTEAIPVGETNAALIVSNLAFLASLIVLFGLTAFEFSVELARRVVLLLAFFPLSYFFMAPYSESLFLVASLLSFWWARRGRWPAAAAAGFVAAITRNAGVLLVPALLIEAWSQDRSQRRTAIAWSLSPLLAPVLYALYCWSVLGDPLSPLHAQGYWLRYTTVPVATLGRALGQAIDGATSSQGPLWILDIALTALLLGALALRWRMLPRSCLVYTATAALVILSTTTPYRPLASAPRYLMVVFPLFWAGGSLLTRRSLPIVIAVSTVALCLTSSAFMNWGPFT